MRWVSGLRSLAVWVAISVDLVHPSSGAESRWIRLRSANFEMYSSANPRSARDTIREFEQVRGFFQQALAGSQTKALPVRLVAFGSAKEYEPYRLNEFATAYYHHTPDRDYIVMSHSGADTFPLAVHEYVHLLLASAGLRLPPWLNEGLAEIYSTLRPIGDRILVGALIPGRFRALQEEKWVPLGVILAAGLTSPYYNEKNKAGSLYNEGWALTHMLCFRDEYRPRFGELLRSLVAGKDSAEAFHEVYGRSVTEVENDLQIYLRGSTFRGALVQGKLETAADEIPVEALGDFDAGLMFADLMYRPGKEAEQRAALERLAQQEPKRPEPYRGLGYLALGGGRREEAVQEFGKAFERGDRDARLLWDYGRLLEAAHGEEAVRVLSELLAEDGARTGVRLELAETQLRANHAEAALATLEPIRSIAPSDGRRLFRIAVYAHLRNGDPKSAEEVAQHFRDLARTDEDRAAAELLMREAARRAEVVTGPIEVAAADPPLPRQVEAPGRASVSGRFVELDCRGKQARMTVETAVGRKVFLIDDPGKLAITARSDRPVEMVCGEQKTPVRVVVGYDPPPVAEAGLDGVVRTLAF